MKHAELLGFDTRNDWNDWNTLYSFARVTGSKRSYMTYGSGPEGGPVRLTSISNKSLWYVWHRGWFQPARFIIIPDGLQVIYRNIDGSESVKLATLDYELGYKEAHLDDIEDCMHEVEQEDDDYRSRRRTIT